MKGMGHVCPPQKAKGPVLDSLQNNSLVDNNKLKIGYRIEISLENPNGNLKICTKKGTSFFKSLKLQSM